ncbi:hypothetical protein NE237_021493 [Protea cynaroides]|uniref:Pentatricopeptide repeat-containing protein n=1 Tax=Protea cynaroides TaxID=273540 RepID=A0A9Q0HB80_9MAGN|nr:hypothetical protein NE237_021493 [Protea cynaroides]
MSPLKPEYVLEILQGFVSESGEAAIEARKVELLWELFKSAANQSKEFKHLPQSHEIMASMLIQVGLLREAEILLRTLESLLFNTEILSAMVEEYAKETSELHELWKLAWRQKRLPRFKDCKALVSHLCLVGQLRKALELLESMLATYTDSSADFFNMFLEELCAKGCTIIGYILVEEVLGQGWVLDQAAYTHLIRGFCKEKRFSEAFGVLDAMLEKNIVPCVDICTVCVPHIIRSHRMEKVMALKERIFSEKPTSCLSVYSGIVKGYCKMRKVMEATLQFKQMWGKGVQPNSETYNIMVQGHCEDNNLGGALEFLASMTRNNFSLSMSSYCTLVCGNDALVTTLLHEMHEKGLLLDDVSCNFVVLSYLKCKNVSRSLEVLKSMVDKDLKPNDRSFGSTITHLCGGGELDKALEISTVMESRSWVHCSVVQNAIAVGLLSHGLNKAVDLMNIMLKKGNIPSPSSYDFLVQSLCACKALDQALDFNAEMLDKKLEPSIDTWDALVNGLCKDGQTTQAEMLLDLMLQLGQTPTQKMYHSVINKYCSENHPSKVSEFLHKMQRNGFIPYFEIHWLLISNLRNSNDNNNSERVGFLSNLLSQSSFTGKKDPNNRMC